MPADAAQCLDDDRRLAYPAGTRDEDVLAVFEPLDEPAEVRLSSDEVGGRDRTSHGEVRRGEGSLARPEHRRDHTSDVSKGRQRCIQRARATMGGMPYLIAVLVAAAAAAVGWLARPLAPDPDERRRVSAAVH